MESCIRYAYPAMTAPAPAKPTASIPPTLDNFITQFLHGLGISNPTPGDYAALEQVAQAEGPNQRYNPFNTVQQEPGSTPINSAGVQQYNSFDSGVAGSVALFNDNASILAGIPQALQSGSQSSIDSAFQRFYATWGSHIDFAALPSASGNQSVGPNPGSGTLGGGGTGSTSTTYVGPGSGVIDAITSPAQAAEEAVALLDKGYHFFTNLDNWVRIGFVLIGVILLIVGIDKLIGGGLIPSSNPLASTSPAPGPTPDPSTVPGVAPPPPPPAPGKPGGGSKPSPYTPKHAPRSGRHEQGGKTSSVADLAPDAEVAAA